MAVKKIQDLVIVTEPLDAMPIASMGEQVVRVNLFDADGLIKKKFLPEIEVPNAVLPSVPVLAVKNSKSAGITLTLENVDENTQQLTAAVTKADSKGTVGLVALADSLSDKTTLAVTPHAVNVAVKELTAKLKELEEKIAALEAK